MLNWAALLHDIGKLKVDKGILTKAGRPTADEWKVLRSTHATARSSPLRSESGSRTGALRLAPTMSGGTAPGIDGG